MTTQLPLPLALKPHARFTTFVRGANRVLVDHLEVLAAGSDRDPIWIWGAAASGKTHLAQAVCAASAGLRVMYLPLTTLAELSPKVLDGLEGMDLIVIDDVDRVAASAAWNRALFALCNDLHAEGAGLLLTAAQPPNALQITLADLASRLAAAAVYQLQPLDDVQRGHALQLHAQARGLALSDAAARYLISRVPRDMAVLCDWLEALDRASMASQRKLSIPLIRATLAERS